MFATLDQEGKSPFAVGEEKTPNEVLYDLEKDVSFQEDINKLNFSGKVNQELSEELYSILQEAESLYHDVSHGNRFINWEIEEIPYQILRKAASSEAGRLIKNKRRLDLVQFAKIPRKNDIQRGVSFIFANPSYQPDKATKLMLEEWSRKLIDNFFYAANEYNPSFARFLGNAYEDWFDVDDITIEKRKNGLRDTIALHLADPIIYKPVVKQRKYRNMLSSGQDEFDMFTGGMQNYETLMFDNPEFFQNTNEEPDYLLIYKDRRIAGVTREAIEKHHFFTRTDFRKAQRGFSVTEQGLNILTYIINSLKHNASNFDNNRTPRGLLAFTGGGVGALQLEKLKKIMNAHMTGAGNRHRFPMVGLKGEKADAKWINVDSNSKDMEYHVWMTLLFSIWCQLSGTNPKELSLGSHDEAVGKPSLFEERTDGVIKESRDSGIRSFLHYIEEILNTPDKYGKNVFQQITNLDIKIKFLGLEIEDKKISLDILKESLQTTTSMNESLASIDKEPQTLMIGDKNLFDIPGGLHPTVYQALLVQSQQMQQQTTQEESPAQQSGEEESQEEEGLTDADRALIEKYKNTAQVEDGLKNEEEL